MLCQIDIGFIHLNIWVRIYLSEILRCQRSHAFAHCIISGCTIKKQRIHLPTELSYLCSLSASFCSHTAKVITKWWWNPECLARWDSYCVYIAANSEWLWNMDVVKSCYFVLLPRLDSNVWLMDRRCAGNETLKWTRHQATRKSNNHSIIEPFHFRKVVDLAVAMVIMRSLVRLLALSLPRCPPLHCDCIH